MKKIYVLLFSLILTYPLMAMKENLPVQSAIQKVHVFLRGAQIFRTGSTSLEKGNHTLVFNKLPQNLLAESIQVKGKGNFTVLSVKHQINYLTPSESNAQIESFKKQLKEKEARYKSEKDLLEVYSGEEKMLLENIKIGGTQTGVNVEELKSGLTHFRTKMKEIKKLQTETRYNMEELEKEIKKLKDELQQLHASEKPSSEIRVEVTANGPTKAEFDVNYYTPDAGWYPVYDVRATELDKPVTLIYKAQVFQTSGEPWNKVQLFLSTGNPSLGGTRPTLHPWYLNFYIPRQTEYLKGASAPKMARKESMEMVMEDALEMEVAPSSAEFTAVQENQTNIEFQVKIPYDIPTNGNEETIEIQNYNLPAEFIYYCAPKLDKDAFLTAKITEWENLNLLPGSMNIFFEGTYVGESHLNPTAVSDTLTISLGRDQSILVERKRLKDETGKNLIGTSKKEVRGWEINVRNNKSVPIDIKVEDQVPVSTNKEITVDVEDISGASHSREKGILSWDFSLKPAETKKFLVKYTVKYPKDKQVILE